MDNTTYDCTDQTNSNTTYCQNEFQRASDVAFGISFLINVILLAVFGVGFLIFKSCSFCTRVYVNRTDVNGPPPGLFGWIRGAWAVSEREIVLKRGMDMAVYLLVLKYMFFMTLGLLPYGIILIITHSTAGGSSVGIASIGLGNVPSRSPFLIADVIGVFWNTAVVLVVMYMMYWRYVELRLSAAKRNLAADNYTVMVREVGVDTTDQQVFDTFDRLFPGRVVAVNRAYNIRSLAQEESLRKRLVLKVEEAHAVFVKKGKRPNACTRPRKLWCCPPLKDARDFFSNALVEQDLLVAGKLARLEHKESKRLPVVFVTFKDIESAQVAAQCHVRTSPMRWCLQESWLTTQAPPPASVNWGALRIRYLERWIRAILVGIATLLLVFFWTIPVAFAASLANITALAAILPFLEPLLSVPAIKGFIEGFLPGLILIIFFAILVSIIITRLLVGPEGHWHLGRANEAVMTKYYFFLVINVFFVYALAGGILNLLPALVENPLSIVQILATSLPEQVQQFLSYVMIASLSQFPMELWRPGDAIKPWLFTKIWCLAKTKRARRAIWGPYFDHYHVHMSRHLLLTVIVLTYSTLNPLIIPFGLVYYGLAYTSCLYNIVYVFTHANEQQGASFPAVFARLMVSLLVYQICMAGVLGLKEFIASVAVFAAILITCLFWYYTHYQLGRIAQNGSLLSGQPVARNIIEMEVLRKVHPADSTYRCPLLLPNAMFVEDQDPNVEVSVINDGSVNVTWISVDGGAKLETVQYLDDHVPDFTI